MPDLIGDNHNALPLHRSYTLSYHQPFIEMYLINQLENKDNSPEGAVNKVFVT